ncbi:LLM class flavin-dependent oxidoreductase [Alteribacter populi]|uniref:LLM class flavin-dependent oxidoreductase n=1 Tax=Alteribacter populi TaxID=2011011 RepID=UPI000BBAB31D|nr:LLM class flavin-dependent oxidoreductase [Alteribacter populi]
MKLSILDQSPISSGSTAREALLESMKLAQAAEKLGYTRYWVAEHHDYSGLASSAPEVLLSYIGAHTNNIRIGSGAVLLPHYKPYKVAETYNMLATLFPERIDLGIGRAPGGSAEATMALSDNFLEKVRNMPESTEELIRFLTNDFPSGHMYAKVYASPLPPATPEPWILGTSEKSAILAAKNGAAYAFGQFMSEVDGKSIMKAYIENFQPSKLLARPKSIIAVSVICAQTTEYAEELALSVLVWHILSAKGEADQGIPSINEAIQYSPTADEKKELEKKKNKMVIGNPQDVKQQLVSLQAVYQVDEIMIVTNTHSYEARLKSFKLIANELLFEHS